MHRLKSALSCVLLATLIAVAISVFLLLRTATAVVSAMPAEIQATRAALVSEIQAARGDLAGQVALARADLLNRTERQVSALRKDVIGEVAEFRSAADGRIGDTLAQVDMALDKVEELRGDLRPTLDHAASITKQIDNAAPLFLDCDHNPDCLFNRYVGVSKSFERAAGDLSAMTHDFRSALPPALATWQDIGRQTQGVAANLNRLTKPRWYDRVLGYGLNGVVIYRNLNPATSLTVKGAQIISARP